MVFVHIMEHAGCKVTTTCTKEAAEPENIHPQPGLLHAGWQSLGAGWWKGGVLREATVGQHIMSSY